MFTTICFRDDFDDFEGFVMPSIRGGGGSSAFLEESKVAATPTQCMNASALVPGVQRNDYVNSSYRGKRTHLLRDIK